MSDADPSTPLGDLGVLAQDSVVLADGLEHHEAYTMSGLLTVLWHPADGDERAVIMCGGAMGGLLGGGGLFHNLGTALAEQNIAAARVSYRQPNRIDHCVHDVLATMQILARRGARRFVTIGHSFGGAVAIRAAANMNADLVPGVVTLATQSADCEPVSTLGDRQLLFFHGTNDQILPAQSSEMVRAMAGHGELVLLDGHDHLLKHAKDEIADRLLTWLPETLAEGHPVTDPR